MPLPNFLAKPIFRVVYTYMRRKEGATFAPIRRVVKPVDLDRQRVFDALMDSALIGVRRKPLD